LVHNGTGHAVTQVKWLQNRNFSGRQQAKEQSSCSKWTGIPLKIEQLLWGLEAAETRFWAEPRRVIYLGGAEVVRRMASRKPLRIP